MTLQTITIDTDTHRVVPVEPSEEMLCKATRVDLGKDCDEKGICISLYQAMIAAAPQPEPVESEPVAKVRVHKTGGNAGISWSAVPLNDFDSLPVIADGALLFTHPQADNKPVESEPDCYVGRIEDGAMLLMSMPDDWEAIPLYTTPQPDRTAELEAALKVAKDALGSAKYVIEMAQLHKPGLKFAQQEALAKINEVLK